MADMKKVGPTPSKSKFCDAVVNKPGAAFGMTLGLQLLGAVLAGLLVAGGLDVFYIDKGLEWSFRMDKSNLTERDDGWTAMLNDETNTFWSSMLPARGERSMEFAGEELEFIYNGECFSKNNLVSMEAYETTILNMAQPEICVLEGAEEAFGDNATAGIPCRPMKSILRLFDGTFEKATYLKRTGDDFEIVQIMSEDDTGLPLFRPDPTFERIEEIARAAFYYDGAVAGTTDIRGLLQYAVGIHDFNEFGVSASQFCRSKLYAGAPFRGYKNFQKSINEQREKMRRVQVDTFKEYLNTNDKVGNLQVYHRSKGLRDEAYDNAHTMSFFLCVGSALVICIGVITLTRSVFLGSMLLVAQFGIFMWTCLVYRYMFQYKWVGIPQQLSIFPILAVTTTNFLLLLHEFKQASNYYRDNERLTVATRQSNKSVVFSALIGSAMYFAHCFSTIVVVEATGLFYGLSIVISLLTYLVFFPALIHFWHVKFKPAATQTGHEERHRASDALFSHVIGHKVWRWFLAAGIFIAMAVLVIITVKQMALQKAQPLTFRPNNNFGKFDVSSRKDFGHSESGYQTTLLIIWGLDHLDTENCHKSDITCSGTPVYDNLFDLSWHEPQNELIRFCDDLEQLDGAIVNDLRIQRRPTGPEIREGERPTEIKCFIQNERDYYQKTVLGEFKAADGSVYNANVTMPFLYEDMAAVMQNAPNLFPPEAYKSCAFFPPYANDANNPSCRNCDSYYRHFEAGMLNWATSHGDSSVPPSDLEAFAGLVGASADSTMTFNSALDSLTYAGDYGNFIRYAAIEVNLTISSVKDEYDEVKQVLDRWDSYLLNNTASLSKPVQRAYQATPNDRTWAWANIQANLITQAIQGMVIAISVYFVCMVLYTNNFAIGILATITVAACPTTLVGVYTALDWNLGLLELVYLVLPIGMSVDFVSHFAIWYTLPEDPNVGRLERTAWAFSQGVYGVFGGAFMMFGAALFLLGSPLEFVFGFGVTLSFTLGMGLALGMFLFLTVMGIMGPEGQDCSIMKCLAKKADGSKQNEVSKLSSVGVQRPLSRGAGVLPGMKMSSADGDSSDSDSDGETPQLGVRTSMMPGPRPGGAPGARPSPIRPGAIQPGKQPSQQKADPFASM